MNDLPRAFPERWVFLCGAHMDQVLRLEGKARFSGSNPATAEVIPGGSALNSASVAAAMGVDTVLLSPVGDDSAGNALRMLCGERGITAKLPTEAGRVTGLYTVLIEPDGNVVIGAADLGIYDAIDEAWIASHLDPLLDRHTGLFLPANLPGPLLERASLKAGLVAGATISQAKAQRLLPVLSHCSLLFTNLAEARALCAMPQASARQAAEWCVSRGIGAGTISDEAEPLTWWLDGDIRQTPVVPVDTIADENGAGDALAGAVIAGLAGGLFMERAVDVALAAAALCLQTRGPYPDPQALAELAAAFTAAGTPA